MLPSGPGRGPGAASRRENPFREGCPRPGEELGEQKRLGGGQVVKIECKLVPAYPLFPKYPCDNSRPFGWEVSPPHVFWWVCAGVCPRHLES